MNWQQLTDSLSTEAHLKDLTPEAVDGIVTLLAVVMYADQRATILEREEFRDLVDRLPFYDDKHATVRSLEDIVSTAGAAHGEAGFRKMIDSVAGVITEPALRKTAFKMAATMAYADLDLQAQESAALGWMAAAFNLDQSFVDETYAEVG